MNQHKKFCLRVALVLVTIVIAVLTKTSIVDVIVIDGVHIESA